MRKAFVVPGIAAVATLLVHSFANAHYGFFRDELYFIACGRRPDWGYVDQPPLVPLLAAGTQAFGHSLFLLRAIPALFAAAGVFTTCLLVTEFGGGRFAQAFAALIFLFTGVLTSFGGKVSTDEVGLWTWPLIALLVLRIAKGGDRRLWIVAGVVTGVTLQSKYSVPFFLAALAIGLAATPVRRILRDRYLLLGCIAGAFVVLPNVVWQWHAGFPMLELLRNGQTGKNLIASPLLFLLQELLITTPFLAPVWIVGLVWLLRRREYRFLGIAYVVLIAEMIVFHGKHYYPANIYPVLIAAGAVPFEAWTRERLGVRAALVAYAALVGIVFEPFAAPVLPEAAFVRYGAAVQDALHIPKTALATEHGRESSALPGDFADMHGWPELAATVRHVYETLPPSERSEAVVVADNYGTAAAIEFFTPDVPVISTHNQFWLWGTAGHTGNVLVQVGGTCWKADRLYDSRTVVTTFSSRWGLEQNLPIAICRGLRKSFAAEWADSKEYI
ncbi:MAG: glycosyltransferase family 39 protein [Candidatus Eremiobacteraeota bacterium]|nr:glycosyltransferase family 39 protein [Candidatus Eremiobacteraeota bacterium]